MSTSRSTSFASRQTTTSSTSARGSPNYGTVLSPGQSAVYPSSIFTATYNTASGDSSASAAGLSKGAIAGIAVASGLGALLLIASFVALFVWRKRRGVSARVKRESRTTLLAGSGKLADNGHSTKPSMRQSNGFNTFAVTPLPVAVGATTYAPASAVPTAGRRFVPSAQTAVATGTGDNDHVAGHRRYDSAASSAPLLHSVQEGTRASSHKPAPSRSSGESDLSLNYPTQRSMLP